MSDSDLIRIRNLSHRYSKTGRLTLDNVTLDIPRGSRFGLLGPNGAGKTTLLSILTGVQKSTSGSVHVAEQDIRLDAARIKRLSAYVPQEHAFYLALSGRENLRFFADVYGLSNSQWLDRLEYCVAVCRLHDLLDRRSAEYSGGMKRRLNLAIGLLNAPQILYLDEPTVGVDAISRQVIVDAIRTLPGQGTTVIYTSHYMEEVEAICDELAILDHGHVVARDTTANLLQQGQQKIALLTLDRTPDAIAMQALRRWAPEPLQDLQIELTLNDAQELGAVIALCQQQQLRVEQVQFGISRLERIYLALLKTESSERSHARAA